MNNFKEKARTAGKLMGTMLSELYSPNIPVLFKRCGFDYFIVDCEHGCFDYSSVAALAAVSKQAEIGMLVRIPSISREYIQKYLDMGVDGLVIPMVSHAHEAARIVEYSRFAPAGKRGISVTRAHSGYFVENLEAYMEKANREVILLIQIETVKALENMEPLAKVEGIDGVIVGPNDLACDMGIPGRLEDERLREAVRRIHLTTMNSKKLSGIITANPGLMKECMDLGMKLFSWNSEVGMIIKSAKNGLNELQRMDVRQST